MAQQDKQEPQVKQALRVLMEMTEHKELKVQRVLMEVMAQRDKQELQVKRALRVLTEVMAQMDKWELLVKRAQREDKDHKERKVLRVMMVQRGKLELLVRRALGVLRVTLELMAQMERRGLVALLFQVAEPLAIFSFTKPLIKSTRKMVVIGRLLRT